MIIDGIEDTSEAGASPSSGPRKAAFCPRGRNPPQVAPDSEAIAAALLVTRLFFSDADEP
jgi:hypothetical protein